MGHHLGGAPKISGWLGDDWASNEGASDYYATLKCLRDYFADDDNVAVIKVTQVDPVATRVCKKQWNTPEEIALCQRISLAGSSVAYLFQDLSKEKTKPEFDTPDKNVVTEMDDAHPATQCRLDTYLAGLSCTIDKSVPVSDKDYKEGTCVEGTHDVGYRPRCWFFPGEPAQNDDAARVHAH
jgi:hypothetical protein